MTALESPWPLRIAAVVAVAFGALTILSGGTALFGGPEARAAVGDAVPFVLWFNFLAGFAYVAAGIGLWLHVAAGGAFEPRTVGAMMLRSLVWLAIAILAWRALPRD
jgi:hypothetical protein